MLTSVKGYFEDGKIVLNEEVSFPEKTEVIVIFLDEDKPDKSNLRIPGGLKGKVGLPDDFNEPLEDLKEYM